MSDPPFKPILLDLVHHAQRAQDAFVQALDPTERDAMGSPERWSARDHIAHTTFWRQRLNLRLRAIVRREAPPEALDFERVNPVVFERQRRRPWSEILAESDEGYAELVVLANQLGDDDWTAFQRFNWIPDGWPLYTAFMGNCYEHTAQHLAQYFCDRDDLPQGLRTYEAWVDRVVQAASPDALKGYVLYNLACFYATHAEMEQAETTVRRALLLHPTLMELARTDSDLAALRAQHPEMFA